MSEVEHEPPPKLDPETLVLRGNPARVTRFRRGAIVAIAGAASTAIASMAWLALKPVSLPMQRSGEEETAQLSQKPPSDALAGAPKGYGDVPQLGPPLPGDLGPPILERQRELGTTPAPSSPTEPTSIEQERERREAELRSARQSAVLVQLQAPKAEAPLAPSAAPSETASSDGAGRRSDHGAVDLDHDPNGQQRKLDFADKRDEGGDVNPHAVLAAASPYSLSAGSVIPASLLTGLNSDLPGLVTAQVTQNVYDSATGKVLLIPQGARLVGEYDSVIAFGQSRALVVWKRIVFPDASSVKIDNMPAADIEGYAGLSDRIDRHSWELLKGVALSTLLGAGAELSLNNSSASLFDALAASAQQSASQAGAQLVSRNLNVQPTIRVRPGWPLRVLVSKDIILRPWNGS
jgi:type IV secretory pathway VirB10-like protein